MIDLRKGDCLEVMKDIPDKSVDMILCDLPYGTTACKWDSVIPFKQLWEQYNRLIKDNGAIVLFGSEPFSSYLRMSNIKNYKYDWVWRKSKPTNFLNCKKQPLRTFENVIVFYKKQPTYNPQGLIKGVFINDRPAKRNKSSNIYGSEKGFGYSEFSNYPTNELNFKNGNNNRLHPTQKPVELLEYLIKTYTNEGETVLDNCMGSGSTGIACKNTGRSFIGIELDQYYFDIARNRIMAI